MEVHDSLCSHDEGCENGCQMIWNGVNQKPESRQRIELLLVTRWCWQWSFVWPSGLWKEEAVQNFTGAVGDPKRTFGGIKLLWPNIKAKDPECNL
jgi:hypothetical protein